MFKSFQAEMRQLPYIALHNFRFNFTLRQWHFFISIHFAIHLWLALHCCFLFGHVSSFNVTCPNGWVESNVTGTCLKFFFYPKDWSYARRKCKDERSDLIKINFDIFNTEVLDYLRNVKKDREYYYLGLRYRSLRGIWSWLEDNEPITYHDLSSFPPVEFCTYTNNPGRPSWGSDHCQNRKKFICQKPGPGGEICPRGFIPNHFSGTCFKLITTPQTYEQSKQKCQEEGGDLAMILDENTYDFVSKMIGTNNIDNGTYVGLDDVQENGVFRWLGFNDPLTFTAWADGQPGNAGTQGRCVVINTEKSSESKVWNAVPCDQRALSICEAYADCKMAKYGAFCPMNCSKTNCTIACNPRTGSCLECLGPMCIGGYHQDSPNSTQIPTDASPNKIRDAIQNVTTAYATPPVKKADVSVFMIIGIAILAAVVLGIIGAIVSKNRKANPKKDEKGGEVRRASGQSEAKPALELGENHDNASWSEVDGKWLKK